MEILPGDNNLLFFWSSRYPRQLNGYFNLSFHIQNLPATACFLSLATGCLINFTVLTSLFIVEEHELENIGYAKTICFEGHRILTAQAIVLSVMPYTSYMSFHQRFKVPLC